jgi:hypothetical protein
MLKQLALGAAVLMLCAPAGAALAHDPDQDQSYGEEDWRSAPDRNHDAFHDVEAEAHAQAHAEGFSSPEEHAAWHEAADQAHRDYHQGRSQAGDGRSDWNGPSYGGYPYAWTDGSFAGFGAYYDPDGDD